MLRVRQLAEMIGRLDVNAFEKQMGPFALVQRPPPDSRVDAANQWDEIQTRQTPALRIAGGSPLAMDFADLLVATLPPIDPTGSSELVIGRSPDCELVVQDNAVSKRHAAVQWNKGVAVLVELGSSNGTFVNGHKMKDRWTLRDGDGLRFGESHFLYLLAATLFKRMRTSSL